MILIVLFQWISGLFRIHYYAHFFRFPFLIITFLLRLPSILFFPCYLILTVSSIYCLFPHYSIIFPTIVLFSLFLFTHSFPFSYILSLFLTSALFSSLLSFFHTYGLFSQKCPFSLLWSFSLLFFFSSCLQNLADM